MSAAVLSVAFAWILSSAVVASAAPTPAPSPDEAGVPDLLIPESHADQAALTAQLAHMYHQYTVKKYGKVHPKSELTRAIALGQQHYANALAVLGITQPHVDVKWLDTHIRAKISQFNTHIAHVSPALASAISISAPQWFNNGPNIYTRTRQWISISPRFINISPCLWNLAATGISISPNLVSVSPRVINVNARGLDLSPTLLDIKSRFLEVAPTGLNYNAPTTHIIVTPRLIQWSPSLRLVSVDDWWPNPMYVLLAPPPHLSLSPLLLHVYLR